MNFLSSNSNKITIFALLIIIIIQYYFINFTNNAPIERIDPNTSVQYNVKLFKEIGDKTGTDKVGEGHHYENAYGYIFGAKRFHKYNLLEIGLGCNYTHYTAGISIPLWKVYYLINISKIAILFFSYFTCKT